MPSSAAGPIMAEKCGFGMIWFCGASTGGVYYFEETWCNVAFEATWSLAEVQLLQKPGGVEPAAPGAHWRCCTGGGAVMVSVLWISMEQVKPFCHGFSRKLRSVLHFCHEKKHRYRRSKEKTQTDGQI